MPLPSFPNTGPEAGYRIRSYQTITCQRTHYAITMSCQRNMNSKCSQKQLIDFILFTAKKSVSQSWLVSNFLYIHPFIGTLDSTCLPQSFCLMLPLASCLPVSFILLHHGTYPRQSGHLWSRLFDSTCQNMWTLQFLYLSHHLLITLFPDPDSSWLALASPNLKSDSFDIYLMICLPKDLRFSEFLNVHYTSFGSSESFCFSVKPAQLKIWVGPNKQGLELLGV